MLNKDIQVRLKHIADKQSKNYLDYTEQKMNKHVKLNASQKQEAKDDLYLYLYDYMEDLIIQGIDEKEALNRVEKEIEIQSGSIQETELIDKYMDYYNSIDPAEHQVIGLFYGGFILLLALTGAIIGFFVQGGVESFMSGGYIYTVIGIFAGILGGTALGMIVQAIIVSKNHM